MTKTKPHTQTKNSSPNLKDSKYLILLLLKEGKSRKEVEELLKLSKSTILGHIRDLKKNGLVCEGSVYFYQLTPKGYEITHEEFNKIFYRAGGRFPVEIKVDKRKRFHNLFFATEIIKFPLNMPTNSKTKEFSKNNVYYIINYQNGLVKFHTKKAMLHIPDFTAESIDEGSLETIRRLNLLIEEIENDGFKINNVFKTSQYHIADMWHPLAVMFKTIGSCVLVEDRLIIDFSHKVPELEAVNKNMAEEDLRKFQIFSKNLIMSSEEQINELFKSVKNKEH